MIGNNPLRSQAGNAKSAELRSYLGQLAAKAECIKGNIYSEEERELHWNRRLVMSSDLEVIEMQADGSAVNMTEVLIMANTTGMDAAETLSAARHSCN